MRRVNLRDAVTAVPEGAHVEIVHSARNTIDGRVQYLALAGAAPEGFVSPVVPTGQNQGLSGTGALAAIDLTSAYTGISTVGGAATTTMAEGTVVGQLKSVDMLADAGDCVITVAGDDVISVTLNDVGDACTLMWAGTGWQVTSNAGCIIGN